MAKPKTLGQIAYEAERLPGMKHALTWAQLNERQKQICERAAAAVEEEVYTLFADSGIEIVCPHCGDKSTLHVKDGSVDLYCPECGECPLADHLPKRAKRAKRAAKRKGAKGGK